MRKDVTIRDAAGGLRTVPVELHVGGDEPDLRASVTRPYRSIAAVRCSA